MWAWKAESLTLFLAVWQLHFALQKSLCWNWGHCVSCEVDAEDRIRSNGEAGLSGSKTGNPDLLFTVFLSSWYSVP